MAELSLHVNNRPLYGRPSVVAPARRPTSSFLGSVKEFRNHRAGQREPWPSWRVTSNGTGLRCPS